VSTRGAAATAITRERLRREETVEWVLHPMAIALAGDDHGMQRTHGGAMRGTIVCGVSDSDEGRRAAELGVTLSERLGLRLVLAHVTEGIGPDTGADGMSESVTRRGKRQEAERMLAQLAHEYGVADSADRRVAVGDPALLVGQIAAEEAADLILVGARSRGWPRRRLQSRFADRLETETHVPVLVAPPIPRRRRKTFAGNGTQR